MRNRLAAQIRQNTNVCLFCALRWAREVPTARDARRLSSRAYSSSLSRQAPAGTAVAAKEEDGDEDFPLLRQNAAASSTSWASASPLSRSSALPTEPITRPGQRISQGFSIRKHAIRGKQRPQHNNDSSPRDSPRQGQWSRSVPRLSDNGRDLRTQGEDGVGAEPRYQSRRNDPRMGDSRPSYRRITLNHEPQRDDNATQVETPPEQASRFQGFGVNERRFPPRPHALVRPRQRAVRQETETGTYRGMSEHAGETAEYTPQFATQSTEGSIPDQRQDQIIVQEEGGRAEEEQEEENRLSVAMRRNTRFAFDHGADAGVPGAAATYKPVSTSASKGVRRQSAAFDWEMAELEQNLEGKKPRKKKGKKVVEQTQSKPTLAISDFMSVQQLAQAMKVKVDDLVDKLEDEGFEGARHDHILDAETSAMFADIYGFDPVAGEEDVQDLGPRPPPEDVTSLPPRPPIVTIMGHVDHGKTTILDYLRKTSVVAGEHGGITQHIGAFSVTMPGSERQITFLDTPGHEAFLEMRKRGANVTDIVVLVVAADDSVKPQTIEAIKHALEAKVQLIVAINKVDKHNANIDQVKQDLTQHDIVVEDYGGDYQAIPVSGKTGEGMADLEEAILALADVLDLRAEQDGPAEGQVIESKVTNAGRVATILVRRGVLRVGDVIVAGPTWARVRTLRNDAGHLVQEAYPGDPVQVDGWRGEDPTAGLEVLQAADEQHAKNVVELRRERALAAQTATRAQAFNAAKTLEAEARAKVLQWEAENKVNTRKHENEGWVDVATSGPKKVHFVVKADVAGSVEAIVQAISGIGNHEIQANVIHSGTGPVTESDIRMLATTGETSYAISFNQPVDGAMITLAEAAGLQILDHNVIYRVTEAVKQKVSDAVPSVIIQRVLGEAEVGKIFDITIKGRRTHRIAGCKVNNGTISRANQVRVIRHGETVYTGSLRTLKNVKKDVTEMKKGTECGMEFEDWEDMQEGDQIQCFEEVVEKRTFSL